MMRNLGRWSAPTHRRAWSAILALGLVIGGGVGAGGASLASAAVLDPGPPHTPTVTDPFPVDPVLESGGDQTVIGSEAEPADSSLDPAPRVPSHHAPAADDEAATPPPGQGQGQGAPLAPDAPLAPPTPLAPQTPLADSEELYTVQMIYLLDGNMLDFQLFSDLAQGSVITQADLSLPDGFSLVAPFLDFTVFADNSVILDVEPILAPIPSYEIEVRYLFAGEEIGRETLGPLPEQSVVHDSDLNIPVGYVQANPMEPHVVVAAATLDVPVLADSVPVADVRVWFHHGTEVVGLQDYPGLPLGAVITEGTLVLPIGYRLVEPFSEYTVTGATELIVQVIPDPVDPEQPVPPGLTDPEPDPAPSTTPVASGPSVAASPSVVTLAQTGAPGTGVLLLGALAALCLAAGSWLMLHRARRP